MSVNIINHYPSFGEKTAIIRESRYREVSKTVTAVALIILAAVAGFVFGGFIGLAVGTTIAGFTISVVAISKKIIDIVQAKRFTYTLPDDTPASHPLGKYTQANVLLAQTAEEGYQWKKEIIQAAQESIEISGNFVGGSHFREILHLVDQQMSRNSKIKTHILISSDLLESEDKEQLLVLKKFFGDRFCYLITDRHYKCDIPLYTEENHVKMVVVDGKYFVAGGTGIHPRLCGEESQGNAKENSAFAAKLLDRGSRDMDLIGESTSLVAAMREQFFRLFHLWEIRTHRKDCESRYYSLQGSPGYCQRLHDEPRLLSDVRVKFLVGGPEHRHNNPIINQYAKRIGKARNKIRFANLMFNPPKSILEAVKHSACKKIVGFFNGGSSLGCLMQKLPARLHYPLLHRVYEYTADNQIYHKKVATFDKTHMMIGSFNLGKKSAYYDHEIAFVIKNKKITEECQKVLKADSKRSRKIMKPELMRVSFWTKISGFFMGRLTENFV